MVLVGDLPIADCTTRPEGYCKLVVDTGTSFLTAPSDMVGPLLSRVRVDRFCTNRSELPDITYVIDGERYTLSPTDYVLDVNQPQLFPCHPASLVLLARVLASNMPCL